MTHDPALAQLAAMSAAVGADPLLVQGPGGNTSQKIDGVLWVKASGLLLSEALMRPVFVPVDLAAARTMIAAGAGEDVAKAVRADLPGGGLRPSIETALHALMPHPVVLHAHAVQAMTTSILADGPARAARVLDGAVRWAWVGYHRPGAPLAAAVARALEGGPAEVLVLQNHGVVVGAQTPAAAQALLCEVERRLALPVRPFASAAPKVQGDAAYEPHAGLSGLAFDPERSAAASSTPLIPDQVVFLGGAAPLLGQDQTPSQTAAAVVARTGVEPLLLLAPGRGALVRRARTPAADSLLDGLRQVLLRLPAGAKVTGLSPTDTAALLGWEAERHRQAIDAARAG